MAQKDLTAPTSTTGTDTQVVTGSRRGSKFALDFASISDNEITYIDEASASVTYVGTAAISSATSSAVWKIKKLTTSGTVTSILFADGNANYDNVWDDRASIVTSSSGAGTIIVRAALNSSIAVSTGVQPQFAAVWEALATDFNNAGTMGEKLNDAGAAGNPLAALLVDDVDAGTFGERVQKLLTTAKFLGLK